MEEAKPTKRKSAGVIFEKNDSKKQVSILTFFNKRSSAGCPPSSPSPPPSASPSPLKEKQEEKKEEEKKEKKKVEEKKEKEEEKEKEEKQENKKLTPIQQQKRRREEENAVGSGFTAEPQSEDIVKKKRLKRRAVLFDSDEEEERGEGEGGGGNNDDEMHLHTHNISNNNHAVSRSPSPSSVSSSSSMGRKKKNKNKNKKMKKEEEEEEEEEEERYANAMEYDMSDEEVYDAQRRNNIHTEEKEEKKKKRKEEEKEKEEGENIKNLKYSNNVKKEEKEEKEKKEEKEEKEEKEKKEEKEEEEEKWFEKKQKEEKKKNNFDSFSLKDNREQKSNSNSTHNKDIKKEDLSESTASVCSSYFREYLELFDAFKHSHSFPTWINPLHIKDKNGLRPTDERYDFGTMWVPHSTHKWALEEKSHYTPGMQQYWEIKQNNFDKVVLFKMGRFYEIFYIDACIAQRVCDLRWMGGAEQKPHVGFPEQSLHFHAKNLVDGGYKVVVVEQMETPKELEERNKQTCGPKDKAVRRELCEVYTQGTLIHADMLAPEAKYLLAVYFDSLNLSSASMKTEAGVNTGDRGGGNDGDVDDGSSARGFGLCFVDVATCKFKVGYIEDNSACQAFKTSLAQTVPAEVIYSPSNMHHDALKILKTLPSVPQLSPLANFPQPLAASQELDRYFPQDDPDNRVDLPKELNLCKERESTMCAFAGICVYLRSALLDNKVLTFAQFDTYEPSCPRRVLLDSSALTNLEILQTQEGTKANSLYGYMDHTATAVGSRVFRQWLCAPLCNEEEIENRLDAVEWFVKHHHVATKLKQRLSRLCDVERLMSRVCARGLQGERAAVYFDNIQNQRLAEFVTLLKTFEDMQSMLECFDEEEGGVNNNNGEETGKRPTRLSELSRLQSEGGLFPNLAEINRNLLQKITQNSDKEWQPSQGADEEYDEVYDRVDKIRKKLDAVLRRIAKDWQMSCLKFVHAKYRYEIECPDDVPKKLQQQVDICSTRKGFIRFRTDEIKDLVEELEIEELALKDAIYPFMQKLFRELYAYYDHYQAAIRIIAEIDVYISLAYVATDTSSGPMCRPKFIKRNDAEKPVLYLKNCRHPVAASLLPDFISNDTALNYGEVESGVLLVTGPNMGGKSTVLRQTCIAVMMAQIGSYVPAEECHLTCVDRIYTRIGARDSILEGKSTFLVELEETCAILTQATRYSLAVIDELGRGTSTFDGTAIALAALEYIALVIQCRCLFSTHFHLLCEEFRGIRNIQNFHMAANVDGEGGVTFLYKFIAGACPKSHGMHVAKFAGLPKEVLDCAADKSRELEKVTNDFYALARCRSVAREIIKLSEREDQEALSNFIQNEKDNMRILLSIVD